MKIGPTEIPGLFRIELPPFVDARGTFVKFFRRAAFEEQGLATQFAEEYCTRSRHGVLRGLHFQTPPAAHDKLVCCIAGEVLDAVVDLRAGSPTRGRHALFPLRGDAPCALYIPAGLAHGFFVTGAEAVMLYKVTTPWSPENDRGILWSSAGIPWPCEAPVLSDRDASFPALPDYPSPFVYRGPRGDG